MSYQPVSQSTSYSCAVCAQARTGWYRFQSDTGLYVCNTCGPLLNAGRQGAANGGPNQLPLNVFPLAGNGANQLGYGAGSAPFGNHWNVNPSLSTPGVFDTRTTATIAQTIDVIQHVKDLLGG